MGVFCVCISSLLKIKETGEFGNDGLIISGWKLKRLELRAGRRVGGERGKGPRDIQEVTITCTTPQRSLKILSASFLDVSFFVQI